MLIINFCFVLLIASVDEAVSKILGNKRIDKYSQNFNVTDKLDGHYGIKGGEVVDIRQYPYQVKLFVMSIPSCGGSIISEDYVLTSADCAYYEASKYKVQVGDLVNGGGKQHLVEKIIFHPKYDPLEADYNIAIFKLTSKIILNGETTKAVHLADSNGYLRSTDTLIITGWGPVKYPDNNSTVLKAAKIPVVPLEICTKLYILLYTERMVCLGAQDRFPSGGDYGGPAVSEDNHVQYGIAAFMSIPAGDLGYPVAYTFIPPLREWIKEVTGV